MLGLIATRRSLRISLVSSKKSRNISESFADIVSVVGALTHINFAFAFVDPDTYEITPMDSATPADLFSQTTALKIQSPGLKVFISVGGWTFSDNGTVTQPLLGEIARDSAKRDKFANNVLNFLNHYGFDGIDIDW